MKVVDKIKEAQQTKTLGYSFEYFPPKTELAFVHLMDRLGRMAQWHPEFVSCTWGAGGSTSTRTLDFCSSAQSYGLNTVMHLTCTNMEKSTIDQALKDAKSRGIQNILALRGDPPRGSEFWESVDSRFTHAVDLVRYIRQEYGDYFCIGVAGYPEGHVDCPDRDQEVVYLKQKVDAGAEFIMTQLFYDQVAFVEWLKKCRESGIHVPIVPGIMPIPTYQSFRRMIHLCNIHVPEEISRVLEEIKSDDQKVKTYGVALAVSMMKYLNKEAGIYSFHISTLNLERSTRLILDQLQPQRSLTGKPSSGKVVPTLPIHDPTRAELWDEFPNGRYGDSRSPAFGETLYANQIQPTSQAILKWGLPKTEEDIKSLFANYINGTIQSLPWCEERLQTESEAIRQRLKQLNEHGYLTVSSQPAIDGVPSTDSVYGWGPTKGYVYQKAFIEFFVSDKQVNQLLKCFNEQSDSITYYATNKKGDFATNVIDDDAQNAVTWGVFPGKEIIQPTIIEEASFKSWKVN
ncbi:methylenetetrahydrofolate reductase-domain-containing protein [Pilobolus umbonatus]|nr:methylenetetrahydrofolate reductase-domain-containing protein [Pilobolus umbonatus]